MQNVSIFDILILPTEKETQMFENQEIEDMIVDFCNWNAENNADRKIQEYQAIEIFLTEFLELTENDNDYTNTPKYKLMAKAYYEITQYHKSIEDVINERMSKYAGDVLTNLK